VELETFAKFVEPAIKEELEEESASCSLFDSESSPGRVSCYHIQQQSSRASRVRLPVNVG
jgi:hypothetical protein